MVRCKFLCNSTGQTMGYSKETPIVYNASLAPVYKDGDNTENSKFWEATPSGQLTIQCSKFQPFEPGKEYYLDITPAE